MLKLIVILGLVFAGYYIQENYDFSRYKDEALNTMSQEKTVNTVGSKRSTMQNQFNDLSE